MKFGTEKFFNVRRGLGCLAVLMVCLLGATGVQAQTKHGHGVVVHLSAASLAQFNARHTTQAVLINAARGLYLIEANDKRTDAQLLTEINSDSNASGAELNAPVTMTLDDDQSTVSVLNLWGVDCSTDPNDPYATPNDPTCQPGYSQSTVSVLNDDQSTVSVLNGASNSRTDYYGTPTPVAFLHQAAVAQIAATKAHVLATGRGVVVALIDDGVDPRNPQFRHVLLRSRGINTLDGTRDWSAYADLSDDQSTVSVLNDDQSTVSVLNDDDDQSTVSVLNDDQSTVSVLNLWGVDCSTDPNDPFATPNDPTCQPGYSQSTVSVLNDDQSTVSVLNDDQSTVSVLNAINQILVNNPDFGHGTEVAGLIHLIAPQAEILPIKAFAGNGTADISSIIAAVSYAIDQKVDVINMSFSAAAGSPQLQALIAEAVSKKIIVVAAAGNAPHGSLGTNATVYPAAYQGVLAVAAVDAAGKMASFSNYFAGSNNNNLVAPGVNLLTTFPGNKHTWAVVSGTSFSAPLVAAEGALLNQLRNNGTKDGKLINNTATLAGLARATVTESGVGLVQVRPALIQALLGGN